MDAKYTLKPHRAKIISTIGPSSNSLSIAQELIKEGSTIFRFNLSHKERDELLKDVQTLRKASESLNRPIATIADLPGPKIRVYGLKTELEIGEEEKITLLKETEPKDIDSLPTEKYLAINYSAVIDDINIGELVYIDDGLIRLKVIDKDDNYVICEALNQGIIKPNKGINLPFTKLHIGYPTENDLLWIKFILEYDICDYIALSFVRNAGDVERIKEIIKSSRRNIGIISKIEKYEAIKNLDSIINSSDAIMVARGDLGIEAPIEEIPLIQKDIIRKCNISGKPVITATQMLESMVKSPTPSRAEVTDVANAILDGTDAVMLSAETAVSDDPVRVVTTMRRIVEKTESKINYRKRLSDLSETVQNDDISDAIAFSAARVASDVNASCIVCLTSSGSTARRIAKYRPEIPILAIAGSKRVQSLCELMWGVEPLEANLTEDVSESIEISKRIILEMKYAKKGDRVVFTLGTPMGVSGTTNLIQVLTI